MHSENPPSQPSGTAPSPNAEGNGTEERARGVENAATETSIVANKAEIETANNFILTWYFALFIGIRYPVSVSLSYYIIFIKNEQIQRNDKTNACRDKMDTVRNLISIQNLSLVLKLSQKAC